MPKFASTASMLFVALCFVSATACRSRTATSASSTNAGRRPPSPSMDRHTPDGTLRAFSAALVTGDAQRVTNFYPPPVRSRAAPEIARANEHGGLVAMGNAVENALRADAEVNPVPMSEGDRAAMSVIEGRLLRFPCPSPAGANCSVVVVHGNDGQWYVGEMK